MRKCTNFTSRTHYKDAVKKVLITIVKNKRSKYESYIIGDVIKATKNSLINLLKCHVLWLAAEQLGKQQLEKHLCSLLQGIACS